MMSISIVYSYLAVEAFINYQLYAIWNRRDDGSPVAGRFIATLGSVPQFESLKGDKHTRELGDRIKTLCQILAISPPHDGAPKLWEDFKRLLEVSRHFVIHPYPDPAYFQENMQRISTETKAGKFVDTARDLIGYLHDATHRPRPDWLAKNTLIRFRGVDVLPEPKPGGTGGAMGKADTNKDHKANDPKLQHAGMKPPVPPQGDNGDKKRRPRLDWVQVWMCIFTGIVAITTIYQAQVTAKAMVSSSRAWIVFNDIGVGFDPKNPGPIQMNTVNVGHSPAITDRMGIVLKIVPGKLTELPPLELQPNVTVYPPNITLAMVADPGVVSAEDANCVTSGQSTAYALGMIEYRDQFGTGRRTGFCLYYFPERNTWLPCPFANAFIEE